MNVDAAVYMLIGTHGQGNYGISGIGDRCIGVRAEEDSFIGQKTMHGEPYMKLGRSRCGRIDTDVPDSGGRSLKAHEDQLAAGA